MIIAVDTGGTKTLVAGVNDHGQITSSIKYDTPKDTKIYVSTLKKVLEDNFSQHKVKAIVIGLPSFMDDQVAIWSPNLGWNNFNLKNELYGTLQNTPIFIENDCKLAGLASVHSLRTIPESAFYIGIGTGIGTAVIENGRIDTALKRSEGGHMLIEYDGVVREWEQFASGKAIKEVYGKYARDIKSLRAWEQIADRISRGLLAAIPLLQPDVIIFGGSIGTYFDNYHTHLRNLLIERLPSHITVPKLVKALHPEEAVVYGCYLYAVDKLDTKTH